jgi:uncharacterized protein (TIGR02996 family)
MTPHLAPLFHAVFDAPGDLARREVLADALLEHGHPRGEFIALQLDDTARSRKRAMKLLERHRSQFLGPLANVVVAGSDQWLNGFLHSAHVRLTGELANEPSWATVEQLVISVRRANHWTPRELASRHLKSLRRLSLLCERYPFDVDVPEHNAHVLKVVREQLILGGRPGVLREGAEWFT